MLNRHFFSNLLSYKNQNYCLSSILLFPFIISPTSRTSKINKVAPQFNKLWLNTRLVCPKYTKCLTFWVHKSAKWIYTEMYVRMQCQNSSEMSFETLDTSHPQWPQYWWRSGGYLTVLACNITYADIRAPHSKCTGLKWSAFKNTDRSMQIWDPAFVSLSCLTFCPARPPFHCCSFLFGLHLLFLAGHQTSAARSAEPKKKWVANPWTQNNVMQDSLASPISHWKTRGGQV